MNLLDFLRFVKRMLLRNKFTMNDEWIKGDQVVLEYWNGITNVGDQLSPVIYEWMLKYHNLKERHRGTVHLSALGSVISARPYDAVIWGSGVLNMEFAGRVHALRHWIKYDVRAVRGPFTRDVLLGAGYEVPEVYGDPGVLMPLIYQPREKEKVYDVSVIYNLYAEEEKDLKQGIHKINVETSDYRYFIDEIVKSKRVISASLHGIILAEAYGVPTVFLNTKSISIPKYLDYYHSTNRTEIRMASTVGEALAMEPMPIPDFTSMQKVLIDAFPRDLFDVCEDTDEPG